MFRIIGGLASVTIVALMATNFIATRPHEKRDIPHAAASGDARLVQFAATPNELPAAPRQFDVVIRKPTQTPQVELVQDDPHGRTATVACTTCHSVREPNFETRLAKDLDEFHQGIQISHAQLACYACHNPKDANSLRLADGTPVEYPDVMTLCSQCHGSQATAFAHGAHGGMTGFWDLSRGPQHRNNCVDCHDPHSPSYPKMIPNFKPHDRFLRSGQEHTE